MNKEFNITGYFWLPTNPDNKVPGNLNYSFVDGITIALMGSFEGTKALFDTILNQKEKEYDIIHGQVSNGKNITVCNAFTRNKKWNSIGNGIQIETEIIGNALYIGFLFNNLEDIGFNKISLSYTHLEKWVKKVNFKVNWNDERKKCRIEYQLPDPIEANIDSDYRLKIAFGYSSSFPSFVQEEPIIKENLKLIIESKEGKKNISEYTKIIYQLGNFLRLACRVSIHPLSLKGFTESHKLNVDNKEYLEPIEIYFYPVKQSHKNKKVSEHDFLFTLPTLSENLDKYLCNWFADFESYKPIYDLFFRAAFNSNIPLEDKFLILIKVIEVFNNKINKNKGRGLKIKINQIFSMDDNFIASFFPEPDEFIETIVKLRHYLTHYDNDMNNPPSGRILYEICAVLELVVIVLMLKKIGFKNNEIKNIITNNFQLKYSIDYWNGLINKNDNLLDK